MAIKRRWFGGVFIAERTPVAKRLLTDGIEQVGFVTGESAPVFERRPELVMMGGELCINACLAMSYMINSELDIPRGEFWINKSKKVKFESYGKQQSVFLELKTAVFEMAEGIGQVVIQEGIGYRVTDDPEQKRLTKRKLRTLSEIFCLPAFGDIQLNGSAINPLVYVKETDSLVYETACGSGSIAAALVSKKTSAVDKLREVIQPTGQMIRVDCPCAQNAFGEFRITAEVERFG